MLNVQDVNVVKWLKRERRAVRCATFGEAALVLGD